MEAPLKGMDWEELGKWLPNHLKKLLLSIEPGKRRQLEELRLREGEPLSAVTAGREWVPSEWAMAYVAERDIGWVLEKAGSGSIHMVLDQLKHGFLPVGGDTVLASAAVLL